MKNKYRNKMVLGINIFFEYLNFMSIKNKQPRIHKKCITDHVLVFKCMTRDVSPPNIASHKINIFIG